MDSEEFARRWREAAGDMQLEDVPFVAKGVEGYELARAMLATLAKMHGQPFIDDVGNALAARRDALLASAAPDDIEIGQLLTSSELWQDLQAIAIMLRAPRS